MCTVPQGSGEGTIIQCMDACMGLARKTAKGEKFSEMEPRHGTLFFHDQDDVDNFVNNYSATDSEPGDRVSMLMLQYIKVCPDVSRNCLPCCVLQTPIYSFNSSLIISSR